MPEKNNLNSQCDLVIPNPIKSVNRKTRFDILLFIRDCFCTACSSWYRFKYHTRKW